MKNIDKLKSIAHMIIQNCDNPLKLGAIRLNKILWFSDILAYRATGESISGGTWVRRPKGPVPSHIQEALDELKKEGKIEVNEPKNQFAPQEFRSLQEPMGDQLSESEKELIDLCRLQICDNVSAEEISGLTQDTIWRAARNGEVIPLEATLIGEPGDFRVEVKDWACAVLKDYQESHCAWR